MFHVDIFIYSHIHFHYIMQLIPFNVLAQHSTASILCLNGCLTSSYETKINVYNICCYVFALHELKNKNRFYYGDVWIGFGWGWPFSMNTKHRVTANIFEKGIKYKLLHSLINKLQNAFWPYTIWLWYWCVVFRVCAWWICYF